MSDHGGDPVRVAQRTCCWAGDTSAFTCVTSSVPWSSSPRRYVCRMWIWEKRAGARGTGKGNGIGNEGERDGGEGYGTGKREGTGRRKGRREATWTGERLRQRETAKSRFRASAQFPLIPTASHGVARLRFWTSYRLPLERSPAAVADVGLALDVAVRVRHRVAARLEEPAVAVTAAPLTRCAPRERGKIFLIGGI